MSLALVLAYARPASSREAAVTAPKEPFSPFPRPGDVLAGKYLLTRVLGEGGMGTVFAAHEETLGRDVAVKLLHMRGLRPETVFRGMRREARALAAVDHPNIVRVIEAGATTDGMPFLVMELVHGKTLRLLSEHLGPIDVISTIAFGIQMGRALAAAHHRGVVHGDFKPDNVLVTPEARVKVGDFGLARHVERGRLGTTDELIAGCGTPHYMAPELFLGHASSAASDVYALGATIIELLSGKHMFAVDSVELPTRVEVRRMHLEVAPEPIENLCGPLVAPLGALVRSMVAKDPRERPTAAEVVEGLRYEHLRLRRHFPENEEASSDMDEDDVPAKAPARPAPRDRSAIPEGAPVSARVRAFATEPLPPSFVPDVALPFRGKKGASRGEASAMVRQKATDPMPVPAVAARREGTDPARGQARRNVTEPLSPATSRAGGAAGLRERGVEERDLRRPHALLSGDAVTVPLVRPAAARAPRGSDVPGRARVRPAVLAAIGFACLSAGLLGRDLLQKIRGNEAPTATATASAGATASPALGPAPVPPTDPQSTSPVVSAAPATSAAPSNEPGPAASPTSGASTGAPTVTKGVGKDPGAPRATPAHAPPPKSGWTVTSPAVIDPWAKPHKPAPGGGAPAAPATSPAALPSSTPPSPASKLPFGKEGN